MTTPSPGIPCLATSPVQNKAQNQKSGGKKKAGEAEIDTMKALMLSDAVSPCFKHHSNSLGYSSESHQMVSDVERRHPDSREQW